LFLGGELGESLSHESIDVTWATLAPEFKEDLKERDFDLDLSRKRQTVFLR